MQHGTVLLPDLTHIYVCICTSLCNEHLGALNKSSLWLRVPCNSIWQLTNKQKYPILIQQELYSNFMDKLLIDQLLKVTCKE